MDRIVQMIFNNGTQIPLYAQLVAAIEEQINSGEIKPGQMIPSENKLCALYNVSRTTVRQALNDLAVRGKVVRVKGRGTFIPRFSARKPYDGLAGITSEIKYLKQTRVLSKVLSQETILSSTETAQSLGLKQEDAVIKLERLRFFENEGVAGVDLRFLPFSRFSGLLDENLEDNSLYNLLISKYQTIPSRSIQQICGMGCPEKYADLIGLKPGDPITHFKDIVYDQNDVPFEFGENFYRIDRYQYRIELFKNNQV